MADAPRRRDRSALLDGGPPAHQHDRPGGGGGAARRGRGARRHPARSPSARPTARSPGAIVIDRNVLEWRLDPDQPVPRRADRPPTGRWSCSASRGTPRAWPSPLSSTSAWATCTTCGGGLRRVAGGRPPDEGVLGRILTESVGIRRSCAAIERVPTASPYADRRSVGPDRLEALLVALVAALDPGHEISGHGRRYQRLDVGPDLAADVDAWLIAWPAGHRARGCTTTRAPTPSWPCCGRRCEERYVGVGGRPPAVRCARRAGRCACAPDSRARGR